MKSKWWILLILNHNFQCEGEHSHVIHNKAEVLNSNMFKFKSSKLFSLACFQWVQENVASSETAPFFLIQWAPAYLHVYAIKEVFSKVLGEESALSVHLFSVHLF